MLVEPQETLGRDSAFQGSTLTNRPVSQAARRRYLMMPLGSRPSSRRAVAAPAPRSTLRRAPSRSSSSFLVPRAPRPTPGPVRSPTATPGPPPRGRRARRTRSARRARSSTPSLSGLRGARGTAGTGASQHRRAQSARAAPPRGTAATPVMKSPRRSAACAAGRRRRRGRARAPPRRGLRRVSDSRRRGIDATATTIGTPHVHGMQSEWKMTSRPPRGETPTLSSPISARNARAVVAVAPVLGVEVEEDGVLACV